MQSININNNYIYYIQGELLKNTYDNTEKIYDNFKILLLRDYNNMTSSIYPLNDENYGLIQQIIFIIAEKIINKNMKDKTENKDKIKELKNYNKVVEEILISVSIITGKFFIGIPSFKRFCKIF